MWQLQDSILCTGPGRRFAAVAVSALLLALTTWDSSLVAAETVKANRRIQVTCDCRENQPAGILITRLGDHNLTLKNFRAAESQGLLQFTVDTESGAVCTTHDDQLDFESQREFQFRVLADEESEYDEFLAEFSAGLIDSGLPEDNLKSLSVSTVVFDINVRLSDVPESPVLEDSHFLVELASKAPVEFGSVNTSHQLASAGWQFYIASGNEDGIFEIDLKSGVLTLDGSVSCNSDMRADFELQILVENSAGEFETSNVFVNVHREIPELVSEENSSMPSTTSLPEENPESRSSEASAVLVKNETNELTAEINGSQGNTVNANGAEMEAASSINTLPNINEIDVAEVQQWVSGAESVKSVPTADFPGVNSNAVSRSPITRPIPNLSAQISFQDSPGYLLTIGAFSVFLMACIAVLLIWSGAAENRAQKLEDEASDEQLKAALNGIQQNEEIQLLKSELADRDQTISQLKEELRSITHDFESDDVGDNDFHVERDQNSWAGHGMKSSSDSRLIKDEVQVSSLPHRDSIVDARTGLGSALEQIGRQLARDTQSLPFAVPSHEVAGEFLCESTEAAVATLDDPQDLRSELADLFAVYGLEESGTSTESFDLTLDDDLEAVSADSPNQELLEEQIETSQPEVQENQEQASENLHLDSVKLYLSKLLERSQDATTPEAIPVDRRKTADSHRGIDRRAMPEPSRPPVKSYLDAYMSAHGGELAEIADKTATQSSKPTPEVASEPLKPRPPVDVDSIRETMNSFRVVAIQSSEHALLSHLLREATAKIAGRTVMVAGLAGVTILIFLANMKHVIDFSSLNWLMCSLVLLSVAELCLRIHAVIKQRRSVTSSVLPPRPVNQAKRLLPGADSVSA